MPPERHVDALQECTPITDKNVDQALDGPEISEEETVTDEQEVSEQVRKEQIESDGEHL